MPGRGVTAAEYLDPVVAAGLPWRDVPVVDAHHASLADRLVVVEGDPRAFEVPIVPWPTAPGRPLDPGTGVGGGITEGEFRCSWRGDRLFGSNGAVAGEYVLGFAVAPEDAAEERAEPADQVLLWHVDHHPDGGQLFASLDGAPFLVPTIPPGDTPDLDRVVVAACDGSHAVCLHPGVWHDGVFPASGDGRFLTRQGRVHARISCDIGAELGCLLRFPLR